MDTNELQNRFAYHAPKEPRIAEAHKSVRDKCGELAHELNGLVPEGREKSLAMTHLEEVMFWANSAIARTQRLMGDG